jgi:hypothetical protein
LKIQGINYLIVSIIENQFLSMRMPAKEEKNGICIFYSLAAVG